MTDSQEELSVFCSSRELGWCDEYCARECAAVRLTLMAVNSDGKTAAEYIDRCSVTLRGRFEYNRRRYSRT
jgi:hypothetical protein